MDKDKLVELWALVEKVGKINNLNREAMTALGSVFGQMKEQIYRKNDVIRSASKTIRTLDRRMQKAESKIRRLNKVHERSSDKLHSRAQRAETQLEIARREIAGLKMDARVANSSKR